MPVSVHHPRYQALQAAMTACRKKAGLSQALLAQQLEVGQSYVSKIERGEAYVDVLLFVDWCQACGVRPGVALDRVLATLPSPTGRPVKPKIESFW
ncbi:helix-turn-helix transcriptional regulator [Ottowia beijingensis]|uniref:Helix-turn-helix transcriptional regulator n=2 Tax=Ottowia beijingensis TaxID=1207057 RepID=A0A853IWK4_9BURK|nr:helix-turn-helix domain-containing protein [Ottowia beijingensis]NZA02107.1 helix-turn-helix transcriptional regulator [Ottowia beijingensis]